MDAEAAESHRDAASADVVVTITTSRDPVLRGEVVHVMARTRKADYLPEIVERVRTVWSENAARPEFEHGLRRKLESRNRRHSAMLHIWSAPFDLSHRIRPVHDCFRRHLHGSALARDLLSDRSLAPYLRLWLLGSVHYGLDASGELLEIAKEELKQMMEAALSI